MQVCQTSAATSYFLLLIPFLANTVRGLPHDHKSTENHKRISQSQAESFVNTFWALKSGETPDPNATASNLFTQDFKAYPGSFKSLRGEAPLPVGLDHYIASGPSSQVAPLPGLDSDSKRFNYPSWSIVVPSTRMIS